MLSKTHEYALRAVTFLAGRDGVPAAADLVGEPVLFHCWLGAARNPGSVPYLGVFVAAFAIAFPTPAPRDLVVVEYTFLPALE